MQYGFLIDHTRCIGCHACTVACKAENEVPLGDFRTWVKYVEKGTFPAIKRHFAVLRCNHCTNAPCVSICPVTALQKRKDGIVDIDRDVCIGCRACMQACPYDAIYLNEDSGAVEKCHFCAHKIENQMKPACVSVCPEEAIVYGDLHDPLSRISTMVKEGQTLVRRKEQQTGPNVHYRGVEPLLLEPGQPVRPSTYLWSERPKDKPEAWPAELPVAADTRVVLDVGHKIEWGWTVGSYLVTKGIAAGLALIAPFVEVGWTAEAAILAGTAVTTGLLVEDLTRPRKFLTLLTRGNRTSWLVKGAWILIAFSLAASLGLVAQVGLSAQAGTTLARFAAPFSGLAPALRAVDAVLAVGVAGYTALLFKQCEGRDLWQGRLLLPHLLFQALACGAAVSGLLGVAVPVVALVGGFGFAALAAVEAWGPHPTENARQGAAFLRHLRYGPVPALPTALALVILGALLPAPFGGLPLLAGITLYELAFVRAGQLPPLS